MEIVLFSIRIKGLTIRSKLGMLLENKVFQKLKFSKNVHFDFGFWLFFRYEVELQVENMHNPDDHVEMRWFIYCANPVIPADWDIVFNPFQHMTDHFTIGQSMSFYPNSKILKLYLSFIQIFDQLINKFFLPIFLSSRVNITLYNNSNTICYDFLSTEKKKAFRPSILSELVACK